MSVNIWDNSYEEKAQLNKCDLRAIENGKVWGVQRYPRDAKFVTVISGETKNKEVGAKFKRC